MVYRPETTPADKAAAIVGVILINAGVILAFLNLSGRIDLTTEQPNLEIFNVTEMPPPPPEPPVVEQPKKDKPKEKEGKAAPENKKSQATPIKAPEPKIEIPVKSPVVTAPKPGEGAQPTQGSGKNLGPGTGAGGTGNGTGAGGSGNGSGGGGGGGGKAKLVRGLTSQAYPDAVIRRWPRGGQVFTRLRVEADGRVSQCDVMQSFGDKLIDQWTCALLMQQKAQFRPATDNNGRPIAAWYGYVQSPTGKYY